MPGVALESNVVNLNDSIGENGAKDNWIVATDLYDDRFHCEDPTAKFDGSMESKLHPSMTFAKPVRNIHVTLTDMHDPKKFVLWDRRYFTKPTSRTTEIPNNAKAMIDPTDPGSGDVAFHKLCSPVNVGHKLELHVTADPAGAAGAKVDEFERFMIEMRPSTGGRKSQTRFSTKDLQIGVAPNCKPADDVCVSPEVAKLIKEIREHFPDTSQDYINLFQKNPHRYSSAGGPQIEAQSMMPLLSLLPFVGLWQERNRRRQSDILNFM